MTARTFPRASFSEEESAAQLQAPSVFYFNNESWQVVGELLEFIATSQQTLEKVKC